MAETATAFTQFVIQTLVSESWRSFDTYDAEDSAQDIARQLVEDWGAARVRILGGYFCDTKNRNVYHLVDITDAPKTGFLHKLSAAKPAFSTASFAHLVPSKRLLGGAGVSGALLVGSLILFAALPPISSFANDAQKPAALPELPVIENRPVPQAVKPVAPTVAEIAPLPVVIDLQAKFLEIAAVPYGNVKDFDAAPIRLRGPWSVECWAHPEMLVIREHKLHQTPETVTLRDTPLQESAAFTTVWQSGQRYGIHLEDGSVYILDLVSFDQIKPLGSLSKTGDFTAEAEDNVLNRCI
ncbi:hypothetical protein NBZ79_09350 [Sneathiella marina]|uniref:Uncharacterized protein n=1 Tax=Sneathiella marina TaxID=2950108 RepID=A0ABY4W7M4_9PROT|nr:hypothetical protein [Sneathiella marina]USG63180.1 hypothetical protein NBZ79_09350 [Sneathiella marina]